MSIGMLYAYISYKRYFSDAMVQVAQKLLDKNALKGPLDRVGDLLFAPLKPASLGSGLSPRRSVCNLRMSHLPIRAGRPRYSIST